MKNKKLERNYKSRFCKHCKTKFENPNDCKSIKENGMCFYCWKLKEVGLLKNKK